MVGWCEEEKKLRNGAAAVVITTCYFAWVIYAVKSTNWSQLSGSTCASARDHFLIPFISVVEMFWTNKCNQSYMNGQTTSTPNVITTEQPFDKYQQTMRWNFFMFLCFCLFDWVYWTRRIKKISFYFKTRILIIIASGSNEKTNIRSNILLVRFIIGRHSLAAFVVKGMTNHYRTTCILLSFQFLLKRKVK